MFTVNNAKANSDLWVLPLQGGATASQPTPILRTKFFESNGSFSPDGRWIAYSSTESGPELYVS
jgi:Tol biopolymer transport system component